MKTNKLGLPIKESKELIEDLNVLLSGFQVYYQNLRGIHWNIRGKRFFELHLKFEELYNDAQLKIDAIAERVLTIGGTPLHTFSDYIEKSSIPTGRDISNDEQAVKLIVTSLSGLLEIERLILSKSDAIQDEGTSSMISEFISIQEKTIWMMNAWLEEGL